MAISRETNLLCRIAVYFLSAPFAPCPRTPPPRPASAAGPHAQARVSLAAAGDPGPVLRSV